MQVITRDQLTFEFFVNETNYSNKSILILGTPKSGKTKLANLLKTVDHNVYDVNLSEVELISLVNHANQVVNAPIKFYKPIVVKTVDKTDVLSDLNEQYQKILEDWLVINLG